MTAIDAYIAWFNETERQRREKRRVLFEAHDALEAYLEHGNCRTWADQAYGCTCGLDEAMRVWNETLAAFLESPD